MMLSSLPPLGPQDAHSLFHPSLNTFPPAQTSSPQHPFTRSTPHHLPRTLLSVLRADEDAIAHRKANIRRFGAGWLRPPGIPKTLQGMADERAEREEQDAAANREFAMQEAQAAAEAEALEQQQEGMGMNEDEQAGLERDMDEDVPDADVELDEPGDYGAEWTDDEEEPEELGDSDRGGFPARGNLDGFEDEGDGDYADGDGARDLDADVPEAGSYQHTDTELEDESSDEGEVPVVGFGQPPGNTSGGVLGSSVFGSSPAVRLPGAARRSGSGRQRREN